MTQRTHFRYQEKNCLPASAKRFEGKTLCVTAPSRQFVLPSGGIDWHLRGKAIRAAEALGFSVKEMSGTVLEETRFAGSDERRAADLMCSMTQIRSDVVMAMRGGYGAGRILDLLDWTRLSRSMVPAVGFSDFTAVNLALLAKTGKESWQGPSLGDLIDPDPLTIEGLETVLGLRSFDVRWKTDYAGFLREKGVLWGGNLSVLTSLLGSDYFPDIEGGILFIEEVGEAAYRIERMLLTLVHAGILQKQKALLIGSLSGADRPVGWKGDFSIETMLAFIRARCSIPVLCGLPFGHIHSKCALPVGRTVQLQSESGRARLGEVSL